MLRRTRTYVPAVLAVRRIDQAEEYLDMFCKKTDTAKQYVQEWMPIVAASQLVKGKNRNVNSLLQWVNVIDFE